MDFQKMMAASMAGEEASPEEGFEVRFRMPEGQELPESALWSGAEEVEDHDETGAEEAR